MLDIIHTPEALYNSFIQNIQAMLNDYEFLYPAGQSLTTRMLLVDIAEHMRQINSIRFMHETNSQNENDKYRLKYSQLSGLIWKAYRKIQTVDAALADNLLRALRCSDGLNEVDATEAHTQFCRHYPLASNYIWPELLLSKEMKLYNNARVKLEEALSNLPVDATPQTISLYQRGDDLLDAFIKQIQRSNNKGLHTFDWKFHTNLLNKATEVILNPRNTVSRDRLKVLVKYNINGKPALSEHIAGAALLFVGAAAIAAGVTLQVLSLGLASPVGIGCMAGGAALCASGFGLFYHGRTKGVESALRKFTKAADSCNASFDQSVMRLAPAM